MTRRNRNTLKNYFRNGSVPTQDQFEDLVDSTLNIIDEGFDKSPDEGLKVAQLGDSGRLVSLFRENLAGRPLYFIRVDRDDNLVIGSDQDRDILFQAEDPDGAAAVRVGINTHEPGHELDVAGVVRAQGRVGVVGRLNNQELKVPADGAWHDITGTLYGCQAFEVTAGVGGRRTEGRYALMHAVALNTFNPQGFLFNFLGLKKKIKYQSAHYRSRNDKLQLRWDDKGDWNYSLQLKSSTDFGPNVQVRYYLTKLWFDEDMSGSRVEADENGAVGEAESANS